MKHGVRHGKTLLAVALLALLASAQGCMFLGNRGRDAAQMFDVGFTFTKTPQFGIYANCPMVTPIGYSNIDGYYIGIGGGKLGVMTHTQKDTGLLLWGREQNSWGEADKDNPSSREDTKVGVLGMAQGMSEGEERVYKPACIHYLHVGWLGVTANFRYYEMFDFAVGWAGLDPARDDLKPKRASAIVVVQTPSDLPPMYPTELLVP